MQNVSAAFAAAMENTPYIARLTLDGIDTIQGDAVKKIDFTGGSNGDSTAVTLGGTVAGAITILLDKTKVSCALEDRELFVEFGIKLSSGAEWLPMGTYKVTDVVEDDDVVTVTASSTLAAKFDVAYEPLEGFDFDAEGGVDSSAFLAALCERRGVKVDLSSCVSIPLKTAPDGYTERQIIGFISALNGGFAETDRYGVLKSRWYSDVELTVNADQYYTGEMEKASYDFTVGWLKCYVEPMAETLILGDTTAEQGVYFECPWMTEERFEAIWTKVKNFRYRPVTGLKFFGDPRMDPGDIITLEDLGGAVHSVPIMAISHEWDGGIITQISASGQVKTSVYEGPVKRETKRLYSRILKKQNELELSIRSFDGDKIISLINLSETKAYIKAPKIKLEGTVTANNNFKVLQDGSIEAANAVISGKITAVSGKIGDCSIVDGLLKVPAANITGRLGASKIDATDLKVQAANITGKLTALQIDAKGMEAVDVNITGKVTAQDGKVGDWNIGAKSIISGANTLYSGAAMYSDPYYEDGVETTVTLTPDTVYIEKREETEVTVDYATWHEIIMAAKS